MVVEILESHAGVERFEGETSCVQRKIFFATPNIFDLLGLDFGPYIWPWETRWRNKLHSVRFLFIVQDVPREKVYIAYDSHREHRDQIRAVAKGRGIGVRLNKSD